MSGDDFFAPPPFDAAAALQRLARDLRALGLTDRAGVWERAGTPIARAALVDGRLDWAVVRRPARNSPEWQPRAIHHAGDVRDALADLRKKLAAWRDGDD